MGEYYGISLRMARIDLAQKNCQELGHISPSKMQGNWEKIIPDSERISQQVVYIIEGEHDSS